MKRLSLIFIVALIFICICSLVACGKTAVPEYYGTYKILKAPASGNSDIVIDKNGFHIGDSIYSYEVKDDHFYVNNVASEALRKYYKYENGNVLSPNIFMTFEYGQLPTRNGTFDINLISYSGTSIVLSYTFFGNGNYVYVDHVFPQHSSSGTYTLTNGLLTLNGVFTSSQQTCFEQYYVDSYLRIHQFAFVKDMSIFERGQTPSQPGDDNPTTPVDDNPSTHEHNYTAHVVPPTCTEQGYTEYVCSCGDVSYVDNYVSALGYHNYEKYGELNIDTSCALSSTQNYKCSVCGDEITGFANIADGVSDCHNHLEVGETCEHCGYKVYFKNSDGMVLMDIGNNNLSAEFYGEHAKSMGSALNSHITNLFFSDNVKIIEEVTASNCDNLNYIIIPENVLEIESSALYNNRNLTYIDLPQHLYAYIDAFENTPWYNNMETKIVDGFIYKENVLMGIDKENSLPPTSVVLENDTIAIAKDAFYYCYFILSITIPNSVQSIGYSAFSHCTGLTSVILGDNVKTIGDRAFDGCSNLTSITIPACIKYINYSAFQGCNNLTSIVFGGTIEQWNAIEKDNRDYNGIIIHCTDGDI